MIPEVYPNPAFDKVRINNFSNGAGGLKIYNLTGNLVMQKDIDNGITEIDISSFSNGLYILQLNSEKNSEQFKLIRK